MGLARLVLQFRSDGHPNFIVTPRGGSVWLLMVIGLEHQMARRQQHLADLGILANLCPHGSDKVLAELLKPGIEVGAPSQRVLPMEDPIVQHMVDIGLPEPRLGRPREASGKHDRDEVFDPPRQRHEDGDQACNAVAGGDRRAQDSQQCDQRVDQQGSEVPVHSEQPHHEPVAP